MCAPAIYSIQTFSFFLHFSASTYPALIASSSWQCGAGGAVIVDLICIMPLCRHMQTTPRIIREWRDLTPRFAFGHVTRGHVVRSVFSSLCFNAMIHHTASQQQRAFDLNSEDSRISNSKWLIPSNLFIAWGVNIRNVSVFISKTWEKAFSKISSQILEARRGNRWCWSLDTNFRCLSYAQHHVEPQQGRNLSEKWIWRRKRRENR